MSPRSAPAAARRDDALLGPTSPDIGRLSGRRLGTVCVFYGNLEFVRETVADLPEGLT